MEATDVEKLGILDLLPDALLLQMLDLVVVRSRKIGAKRAVVASDDDTAAACRCLLIVEVLGLDASLARDLLERLAVLVLADAANVDGRLGLENVLRASGGILRRTSGNEDCVVVLDQVIVEVHVLLGVGKDSIVGFEAIFVEQSLVSVFSFVSNALCCGLSSSSLRSTLLPLQ